MKNYSDVPSSKSMKILPWLVAISFFMQMLDGTILNTALPVMAGELHISPLRMQAVVIAYMLTAALLIPASGWLADRFGSRLVFFLAICLFTLGSLLCALSPNLEFLVFSRIVQGAGGALMVPVGRLVILKVYPRHELVRILSFVTIPGLIGPLVGPAMGGLLVQYASWHWIFLLNIPFGILGALLTLKYMPCLKEVFQSRFDTKGFIIFTTSIVLITMAMEGLGELHMPKVQSVMLCILGLLLMCLYWLRCAQSENSIFSVRLFRKRTFSVGIFGNLFARLASGAAPFLMPLFLQLGLGFSPLAAGMTMIPAALAGIAGKQLITPIMKRVGFRAFLIVNTLILGYLMAGFSLITPETPYGLLLCLLAMFGTINSMQFTAMNSVTLIDLDNHEAGSGNSLLSVTMQISAVTGIAVAAALLDGFTSAFTELPEPELLMRVFHQTFIWVGATSLATALIFSQLPRDAGKEINEDQNIHRARNDNSRIP